MAADQVEPVDVGAEQAALAGPDLGLRLPVGDGGQRRPGVRLGASENVTTTSGPSEAGSGTPTSNESANRCTLDQPSGTSNVSAGSKPAGEATVPASSARSDLPSSSTCTVADGDDEEADEADVRGALVTRRAAEPSRGVPMPVPGRPGQRRRP